MSSPLVSVIVPTFNHEKFITQCLESILSQETNFLFEIIVGDDFSIDNNREIILEIANKHHEKFNLLFHEHNLGPKELPGKNNFIACYLAAKGKYIALCEGDDYWTDPLKLQKQVDFLEKNKNILLLGSNALVLREEDELYPYDKGDSDKVITLDYLVNKNPFMTASIIFKNNIVKDFPPSFLKSPFGDWMLYWQLQKESNYQAEFYFSKEITCVYRVHEKGVHSSLTQRKKLKQYIQFYKQLNILTEKRFSKQISVNVNKIKFNFFKIYFLTPLKTILVNLRLHGN